MRLRPFHAYGNLAPTYKSAPARHSQRPYTTVRNSISSEHLTCIPLLPKFSKFRRDQSIIYILVTAASNLRFPATLVLRDQSLKPSTFILTAIYLKTLRLLRPAERVSASA